MNAAQRPLALVYRTKPNMACKQYPFFSIDALEKWGKRHPYRDEMVRIIPIVCGKVADGFIICQAPDAHQKLRQIMEAAA